MKANELFNNIKVHRNYLGSEGKGDFWKVIIKYNNKQYTYFLYKKPGSANNGERPELDEILYRMLNDKEAIECLPNNGHYQDFIEEHGYVDSKNSRRVYMGCLKVKENLERMFTRTEYEILRKALENGY